MPTTRKPKASAIIYEKRIQMVQSWIIQDIPTDFMIRQMLQQDWCKERQARMYIKDAKDRWAKGVSTDIDRERKIKIVELQERKRSLKEEFKGTPRGIRVLNDIDKMIIELQGMNKPIQHEVNVHNYTQEELNEFTTEQIIAMLEEIK